MTRVQGPLRELLAPAPADTLPRNWSAIRERRAARRPRAVRIGLYTAAAAAVACALFAVVWVGRGSDESPLTITGGDGLAGVLSARDVSRPLVLELSDGSRIELAAGAELLPSVNDGERFAATLRAGRATFAIGPSPRRWTIDGELVVIEATGGELWVEREARQARVGVTAGEARVRSRWLGAGERVLSAGESVTVAVPEVASASEPATGNRRQATGDRQPATGGVALGPPAPVAAPVRQRSRATTATPAPVANDDWRDAARAGEPRRAFDMLGDDGLAAASRSASDAATLWSLADVARKSGHPASALEPLRRLVAEHPGEAAVASYTLGRTLLGELSRPGQAAAAFERAIELGLPRSLQEPAHAYAVEASGRAGDSAAAARWFDRYRERFPAGRHRQRIERWAGEP